MIALDTNLLVYAHRRLAPEHAAARRAIERAASNVGGWGIPFPCVLEFWSVVTHPACRPRPSTAAEARAFVAELVKAGAQIWLLGPDQGAQLLSLAERMNVTGSRVFDLQIALAAQTGGATEIWTRDALFAAIPGLKRRDPLA